MKHYFAEFTDFVHNHFAEIGGTIGAGTYAAAKLTEINAEHILAVALYATIGGAVGWFVKFFLDEIKEAIKKRNGKKTP